MPDILSTISDVDTRLSRYPTISSNNGLSNDGPSAVVLVDEDLLFIRWATTPRRFAPSRLKSRSKAAEQPAAARMSSAERRRLRRAHHRDDADAATAAGLRPAAAEHRRRHAALLRRGRRPAARRRRHRAVGVSLRAFPCLRACVRVRASLVSALVCACCFLVRARERERISVRRP